MMDKNGKKGVLILAILFLIFGLVYVFMSVAAQPICSCKPLTYKFLLNNTKNFPQTYEFVVDKFSSYVSFSPNKVALNSGEKKSIAVFINLPCNITGEHTLAVIVNAIEENKKIAIPIELALASCYDYGVKLGRDFLITGEKRKVVFKGYEGNYSICMADKKAIPVLITNKGIDNEYRFSIKGADLVRLSGNKIRLGWNQHGIVYLSLLPQELGKFQLNFTIANKFGNIEKLIPITIDVEKCYGIDIELLKKEDILCGCEPKSYEVVVNNTGNYNNSFEFIAKPYWANLNPGNISLDASESAYINLSVKPLCTNLKSAEVELTGFLRSHPGIKDSDSLKLVFLPKEECYKARIIADKYNWVYYNVTSIPLTIENDGEKETTYSISLDAPDWVSSDVGSITLKPKDGVELSLILQPDSTVVKDDYTVKINLDSDGYNQSRIIVIKLREMAVSKQIKEFVGKYLYYLIAALLAVIAIAVFSIKKEPKRRKKERRKKKLLFSIILLAVLAIIGAYLVHKSAYKSFLLGKIGWYLFWYKYYIYTLIVLAVILILITRFFVRRMKEKEEVGKKRIKEKIKKIFEFIYMSSALIIFLGVVVYSLARYNLFIREFIVTYFYYIVAGFLLLIILISIIRFNKWVTDLFLGKRKR